MQIPFKISRLTIRRKPIKYIILHHTVCQYQMPETKIDNPSYQIPGISNEVLEQKIADINYHYIIDKIKEDYQVISCRPFITLCDYPDIDVNTNNRALHIALMGSYDFKIPNKRLFEVLAYRLINPFLKLYSLNPSRILFHNEVSNKEELDCPGIFVDKNLIIASVRKYILK